MPSEIDEIRAVRWAINEGYSVHIGCLGEVDGSGICNKCGAGVESEAMANFCDDDGDHVDVLLATLDAKDAELTAERAIREALEEQLRAMERAQLAGYVAGGLQRHPHDVELRAHIDAEAARTGEALQAALARVERAERERDELRARLAGEEPSHG